MLTMSNSVARKLGDGACFIDSGRGTRQCIARRAAARKAAPCGERKKCAPLIARTFLSRVGCSRPLPVAEGYPLPCLLQVATAWRPQNGLDLTWGATKASLLQQTVARSLLLLE